MASRKREMEFVLKFRADASKALSQIRTQFGSVAKAAAGANAATAGAGAAAAKSMRQVTENATKARLSVFGLTGEFRNLKGVVATLGVSFFTQQLVSVTRELDRVKAKIDFTFGGGETEAVFDRVGKRANELGLNILDLTSQYGSFIAASKASGVELEALDKAFFGVAEAGTALQLSQDQIEGAFFALQQMMAKGKVNAEEFRLQLAERLPIAMLAATRATGLTTAEFTKMLETGQLLSADFVPKFGAELSKLASGSLATAAKSLNAEFGRVKNTWQEFLKVIADSGFREGMMGLLTMINENKWAWKAFGEVIGNLIFLVSKLAQVLGNFAPVLGVVAKAFSYVTGFVVEFVKAVESIPNTVLGLFFAVKALLEGGSWEDARKQILLYQDAIEENSDAQGEFATKLGEVVTLHKQQNEQLRIFSEYGKAAAEGLDVAGVALGDQVKALKAFDLTLIAGNRSLEERILLLNSFDPEKGMSELEINKTLELANYKNGLDEALRLQRENQRESQQEAEKFAKKRQELFEAYQSRAGLMGFLPDGEKMAAERDEALGEVSKYFAELTKHNISYHQADMVLFKNNIEAKYRLQVEEMNEASRRFSDGSELVRFLPESDQLKHQGENLMREIEELYKGRIGPLTKKESENLAKAQAEIRRKHASQLEQEEKDRHEKQLEQWRASADIADQARAAWVEIQKQASNSTGEMADLMVQAFTDMRKGLSEFIVTGKTDFGDMVKDWGIRLSELALNEVFMSMFGKGGTFSSGGKRSEGGSNFLGGIGSFLGSLFHSGGQVGSPATMSKKVNPAIFSGAPRFHTGLRPDEFPAILQRGETVIPRNQSSMPGSAPNVSMPVSINVTMQGGSGGGNDPEQAKAMGREIGAVVEARFAELLRREMRPGGQLDTSSKGRY